MLNNSWNYRSILNQNGQVLVGSSTGNPLAAFLTSSSGTLSYLFGPGFINIDINGPISVGFGGTGRTILTTYGVLLGEGSNNVNVTAAGTDGQILIGSSTGDPNFNTMTSVLGTLTFSAGHGSLNIDLNAPVTVGFGGTGLTILTTYGVLLGEGSNNINVTEAGTDGQLFIASTTGDPRFATVTSSGNTVAFTFGPNSLNIEMNAPGFTFVNPWPVINGGTGRTALTAFGVLLGEGSNNVNVTAAGTDGQVLIGSSTGDPAFSTITSSGGTITFAFGPNSVNLEVTNPSGMSWSTISTSTTLQGGNGYICVGGGALTFALPPAPVIGTGVTLALSGASSWSIVLSGTQVIRFGYLTTTTGTGGILQSSLQGDVVFLVCTDSVLSQWMVIYNIGTLKFY